MDDRLISALSSGRGSHVYGYRVSDLTLRHVLGLFYLDSPYARGGMVDDADVVQAARLFASRNDKEWWAALGAGGFWEVLFKGLRYGKIKRRLAEQERLEEWLDCEQLGPQLLPNKGGKKLKLHWMVTLLASVMRETGCTMAEAWWMRFADVTWAKISWAEQDGAEFVLLDDQLTKEFLEMGYTMEDLGL